MTRRRDAARAAGAAAVVWAALVAGGCDGASSGPAATAAPPAPPVPAAPDLGPAQLAGQRVVFPLDGTTVPADLVRRVRRGEAAGVILFSRNVEGPAALRRLVAALQAIPRPPVLDAPLLVVVDQEGGLVRRVPGGPAASAAELGRRGPAAAGAAGRATGRLLRGVGVNVDLAPVADVARPGSGIGADGRAFGSRPGPVAAAARAFAAGLARAGVAATAKHFPGFGAPAASTDDQPVRIGLPLGTLRAVDERPFAVLVDAGVPLVMMSSAVYPALDGRPAALSPRWVRGELRGRLGFAGVVATDALDTPALAGSGGAPGSAVAAAAAGVDLLLVAGRYSEAVRMAAAVTAALRSGRLGAGPARASAARLLALRERLR